MQVERFKYLYEREEEINKGNALESIYNTQDKLANKYILHDDCKHEFTVINRNDLNQFIEQTPEDLRNYHELIFGWQQQRLKFDIDATELTVGKYISDRANKRNNRFQEISEDLQNEINDALNDIIGTTEDITIDNMIINDITNNNTNDNTLINIIRTYYNEMAKEYEDYHNILQEYGKILAKIVQNIKDTFFTTYLYDLPDEYFTISDATGYDPKKNLFKLSSHIIINNYYVMNNEQGIEFMKRLRMGLKEKYYAFVDWGVNKRVQNFRLFDCQKYGSGRIKKLIYGESTTITDVTNCNKLDSIVFKNEDNKENAANTNLHAEDIQKVLSVTEKLTEGHKFTGVKTVTVHGNTESSIFIYKRKSPTYCGICERIHHGDNSMIIQVTREITSQVYKIYQRCRRKDEETRLDDTESSTKYIGEFLSATAPKIIEGGDEEKEIQIAKIENWRNKRLTELIDNKTKNIELPTLFDNLPAEHKTIYNENKMREFELKRTLCVKAMMKMGKTKNLIDYLDKYFPSDDSIVRFISFRQTFSSNIKEKFPNYTMYNDVKGDLEQNKLIVQVESLHRIKMYPGVEPPDVLILDECESILQQFDSGLLRKFNESFSKFQWMIKYSKHVICMDANISDRTYNILKRMRGGEIHYHYNTWKNATDDKYHITTDKYQWLYKLYFDIQAGEKISIPTSSLEEAKTIHSYIVKKFPTVRVNIYSSETSMQEKQEHFNNVNEYWKQYDVIIYTPTVSAGVSFEEEHFDKIYGYFCDMSCDVETCLQMIGRIRNVKKKEFYIYLSATGNNLPITSEEIKKDLYNKRDNLYKNMSDNYLTFEYGPYGEIKYHDSDYLHMWIENTRIRNLSINNFMQRFIMYIRHYGCIISNFNNTASKLDIEQLAREHSEIRKQNKEAVVNNIVAAADLSEDDLSNIHDKFATNQDLTDDEKYSFEKYKLRKNFNWQQPITDTFVKKYTIHRYQRVYKNLQRIHAREKIDDALNQIKNEEREFYKYTLENAEKDEIASSSMDLSHRYVYEQHRIAIGLLKLCGYNHITDPSYKSKNTLIANFRKSDMLLFENITTICKEFRIKAPNIKYINTTNDIIYLERMLKFINKILSIMYDCRITFSKNEPDMYYLQQSNAFTYDCNDITRPLINPVEEINNDIIAGNNGNYDGFDYGDLFDDINGIDKQIAKEIEDLLNDL